MTTHRTLVLRRAAVLVAAALTLTACTDAEPDDGPTINPPPIDLDATDEPTDDATGTPTDTTDPAPTPSATTEPELPTTEATAGSSLPEWLPSTTVAESGPPSGGMLLPVGLRVGDHDGFDRVVVDLEGDAVPGWRIEYVDEAITDGKGDRLDVDGDAVLQVYVTGTRYPDEGEDHLDGAMVLDGEDVVEEVHYVGTFEGLTQLFIGVDDGRAEFRAFALAEPARLVIDIRED
ncbi:hypothetical protein V2J52_12265 [Georgenia sp. MJ173]|uniref:AMIN-like domain-containing (lipo)protein n=1 Tax=Georgenia sunbinii TaxID=3117728 RepID=UPI002F26A125